MIRLTLSILIIALIGCEEEFDVNNELLPYFKQFETEARIHHFDVKYKSMEMRFADSLRAKRQILAYSQSTKDDKLIVVDRQWFNESSESEREIVMFHEFGHAFLCRRHIHFQLSVMSHPLPRDQWDTKREEMLDELFSKNECN